MPDRKSQDGIIREKTREYPTEWSWYPADEEQNNARVQTEAESDRQPETSTPKVGHAPHAPDHLPN